MRPKMNATREAALFFGVTLGLSYLVCWGPLALFKVPTINFVTRGAGPGWAIALFIAGGFVPSLVAVVLTLIFEGTAGLRRLGRRVVQFDIGWRWYLAASGVVAAATAGQILIVRLTGHSFNFGLFLAQAGSLVPLVVLGPLSEELGWRGYALDRVQTRWNALTSALIVGVAWALWHLPLFYMVGTSQHEQGLPFVGFAVGIIAVSVLFTWLHNNTAGSVWAAIYLHWIYTYSSQVVGTGAVRTPLYNWIEYLPYVLAAAVVVVVWGSRALRRTRSGDTQVTSDSSLQSA